ncbi:hypothetical protein AAZX31_19G087000 [Glycine max]
MTLVQSQNPLLTRKCIKLVPGLAIFESLQISPSFKMSPIKKITIAPKCTEALSIVPNMSETRSQSRFPSVPNCFQSFASGSKISRREVLQWYENAHTPNLCLQWFEHRFVLLRYNFW